MFLNSVNNINSNSVYSSDSLTFQQLNHILSQYAKWGVKGAHIEAVDNYNRTVLIFAILAADVDSAMWLIEHGANIEHCSDFGESPLKMAAYCGHLKVLEALLERGAKINDAEKWGSPLMKAAQVGHCKVISKLLAYGADLEAKDQSGSTALMYAASAGQLSACELLIKYGAQIDAIDKNNETALMKAARLTLQSNGQHVEIVKLLLELGANAQVADRLGNTALKRAVDDQYAVMIRLLS